MIERSCWFDSRRGHCKGTTGEGHLYQGRYKSFLVQDGGHFLTVMRYVEANPLRAGMVRQAQAWPWSSLGKAAGSNGVQVQLSGWPMRRPPHWQQQVNQPIDAQTLARVHLSVARSRPFGEDTWIARVARRYGLESTLRDPWRPRKTARKQR